MKVGKGKRVFVGMLSILFCLAGFTNFALAATSTGSSAHFSIAVDHTEGLSLDHVTEMRVRNTNSNPSCDYWKTNLIVLYDGGSGQNVFVDDSRKNQHRNSSYTEVWNPNKYVTHLDNFAQATAVLLLGDPYFTIPCGRIIEDITEYPYVINF